MAFSNTRRRYASFDTVASIPGEVIDAFWFIIDHHLKAVSYTHLTLPTIYSV